VRNISKQISKEIFSTLEHGKRKIQFFSSSHPTRDLWKNFFAAAVENGKYNIAKKKKNKGIEG
jgi:hypothetical protein